MKERHLGKSELMPASVPAFTIEMFLERIGAPPTLFEELQRDNTWSFIIKTHALLEASLTHMLVTALGKEAITDTIVRLDMSSKPVGKVELAKQLGLLEQDERQFIRTLSWIRNRLVHDVSCVGANLDDLDLDDSRLRSLVAIFREVYRVPDNNVGRDGVLRAVITLSAFIIMNHVFYFGEEIVLRKEVNELREEVAELNVTIVQHLWEFLRDLVDKGKIEGTSVVLGETEDKPD